MPTEPKIVLELPLSDEAMLHVDPRMPQNHDERFTDLNQRISRLEKARPGVADVDEPPRATEPKPVDREQRVRHLILRLIVVGAFLVYVLWAYLNWQEARPSLPLALFAFAAAASIVTFGYNLFFLNLSWTASPPPSAKEGER